MTEPNNKKENGNRNQNSAHHGKHKIVVILMIVFLLLIIVGGLYILNKEGKINIGGSSNTSQDAVNESTPVPDENIQASTAQPEITPNSTPQPTEKVYIPDVGDLQELMDPKIITITDDKLSVEIMSETSIVKWNEREDASYYVLAVYSSKYEEIQKDILWSNITTWNIPGFKSGKVVLYAYKDGGQNGIADDTVIDIYSSEIIPVNEEEQAFNPGRFKYRILIDKASFAMGIFTQDENGQYTELLHTFPCALGMTERLTTVGVWEISSKGPWKLWSTGWYSPYYSRFTAGLYIHGAVYATDDFSTLSPTSYEKIGTNSTSGCIRTTIEGAEWIYYNCPAGTIIEIVEQSDLLTYPGKPAIDPDYTNWDPTDPNKPGNK